jgi:hypothetical protein
MIIGISKRNKAGPLPLAWFKFKFGLEVDYTFTLLLF